ncbi:FtsK/SpoIIIE domain-containing protein [Luteolibacter sp. GHJ8]|uniref:FtsK/SpoIIIE domain-containing protein n=1 Tax=Luteolibacter rhizosphaerae TaxID=2989719 RepID=A0ABT3G6P8_9BACT|nr:FtsK/SpoIIIE domain-containing protein [Luteolibacter rhizosphaerae]MCW1915521.1 FtsK/SpoIIIE domain-containing protein [Luteolibacter rhizosphaerae]
MPTVNDPLHPDRIRQLLEEIQERVSSVSGREAALNRTHAAALLAAKRQSTSRKDAGVTTRADRLAALMAANNEEQARVTAKYYARRQWIATAAQAAHSSLAGRIREAKDRQVGRRQAEAHRLKQDAKETWDRARQDHREFSDLVSTDSDRILAMSRGALGMLWAYRPLFSGLLRKGRLSGARAAEGSDRELLRSRGLEKIGEADARYSNLKGIGWRLLGLLPVLCVLLVISSFFVGSIDQAKVTQATIAIAAGAYVLSALLLWIPSRGLARSLQEARLAGRAAITASETAVEDLGNELRRGIAEQSEGLSETMRFTDEEAQELMKQGRRKIEEQSARLPAKADALNRRQLEKVAYDLQSGLAQLDRLNSGDESFRETEHTRMIGEADTVRREGLDQLGREWDEQVKPLHADLVSLQALARQRFPEWQESWIGTWVPPQESESVVPFGSLRVSLPDLAGGMPESTRFKLDGPVEFDLPLALGLPQRGSLLVDGDAASAATAINEIVLRVLSVHPAGRATFTLIDPVGLGKDFAGLMHLGDYEESLIQGRIWTQTTQIEERLAEINEHIEKVIQMYLRNEYATLDEYNRQAGTVAEKHRFVVISGFPASFSETALKRLLSIATSGARCGVYLLMHRDPRPGTIDPALAEALERACLRLEGDGSALRVLGLPAGADSIRLNPPPQGDLETALVHRIGKASVDSNRVEVPFQVIAPQESDWWTNTTGDELRVPIGRSGAKKFQWLALGKGTRQHALIAGKTGSGKSTLFHVMITNLALHCSPDEVEFYLVDFKKGVEFKCYGSKRLPHARVVAIESDREFGLSVLHRVDDELRRRGELFRKHGSQDLAGYRKASGETMPRTLLMIDEFQEFFTEDDPVSQSASLLLDRIVRQGRAFGIHVILGSQTLGGAYTLARATLGQMVVRIALQCNEADAYLIMDDDNPAPRLLTRPGEGIYNDNAGALAANSPFQTVWLSEEERSRLLDQVHGMAQARGLEQGPLVVFEGNAPADLGSNQELAALMARRPEQAPAEFRAWLGEPNSIKGPTEAVFARRSGSHLLVVGQSDERVSLALSLATLSLAASCPAESARFIVLDSGTGSQSLSARLRGMIPHELAVVGPTAAAGVFADLAAELERRNAGDGSGPEIFVVIHGLQRFKKLRQEDDFLFAMDDGPGGPNPAKVLADLASEGGAAGIHLLAGLDTWNNVGRWLPRKVMAEFEMRLLFQMSANDSANLIDSPAAGSLGLHRALLYNEALGTVETFRPYAEPDLAWWEDFARAMRESAALAR